MVLVQSALSLPSDKHCPEEGGVCVSRQSPSQTAPKTRADGNGGEGGVQDKETSQQTVKDWSHNGARNQANPREREKEVTHSLDLRQSNAQLWRHLTNTHTHTSSFSLTHRKSKYWRPKGSCGEEWVSLSLTLQLRIMGTRQRKWMSGGKTSVLRETYKNKGAEMCSENVLAPVKLTNASYVWCIGGVITGRDKSYLSIFHKFRENMHWPLKSLNLVQKWKECDWSMRSGNTCNSCLKNWLWQIVPRGTHCLYCVCFAGGWENLICGFVSTISNQWCPCVTLVFAHCTSSLSLLLCILCLYWTSGKK